MTDSDEKNSISTIVNESELGLYLTDGWVRDLTGPPAQEGTVRVRRALPTRYLSPWATEGGAV